jgi:hypothetical protein
MRSRGELDPSSSTVGCQEFAPPLVSHTSACLFRLLFSRCPWNQNDEVIQINILYTSPVRPELPVLY